MLTAINSNPQTNFLKSNSKGIAKKSNTGDNVECKTKQNKSLIISKEDRKGRKEQIR